MALCLWQDTAKMVFIHPEKTMAAAPRRTVARSPMEAPAIGPHPPRPPPLERRRERLQVTRVLWGTISPFGVTVGSFGTRAQLNAGTGLQGAASVRPRFVHFPLARER